jgi:DNA-binding CsgD family transcriptional regulator
VVRLVAKGGVYFSAQAFEQWQKSKAVRESVPTARQLEILSQCAAYPNLTTVELAKQLSIAPTTVRNLLSLAYRRLGVANRAAAITKARHLGLITPYVEYRTEEVGRGEEE